MDTKILDDEKTHGLILTIKQNRKFHNAFENHPSADMKLSKNFKCNNP